MEDRMPRTKISIVCREVRHGLPLIIWCALLTGVIYGQVEQKQPDKSIGVFNGAQVSDAIEKLKSGHFDDPSMESFYVERLTDAKAVQAIPVLERRFVLVTDSTTKMHIASALVRLGDKDDTYWNFLEKQASAAVDSPDFRLVDSQGKIAQNQLSPEFLAWAKAHDLPPDPVYGLPGNVILLGRTGDPRGIPLLRRALMSNNFIIQVVAAKGLAQIHDKDSIPLIINACQRGSAEAAAGMAQSLLFFDDPRAQSAIDMYVPNDLAKAYREEIARGMGPFGVR
jgi:hypothetical protein